MTSIIVEALEKIQSLEGVADEKNKLHDATKLRLEDGHAKPVVETRARNDEKSGQPGFGGENNLKGNAKEEEQSSMRSQAAEPSLSNPKPGNAISHGQLIDLSRKLKAHGFSPRSLDILLRGARIYIAPPPPKPEPTSEYKALMARLRREEEARSYGRMTKPPLPMETFAQRFPMSSAAHAFSSYQEPEPEDEFTYADVNRQMAMIANVLLSIAACAGAIWIAARWWSTPARLALSMSGSLLVGVAEVVVYGGYIRRVSEAKGKEKGVQEIREVVKTWVVGGEEEEAEESEKSVLIGREQDPDDVKARRRKKNAS